MRRVSISLPAIVWVVLLAILTTWLGLFIPTLFIVTRFLGVNLSNLLISLTHVVWWASVIVIGLWLAAWAVPKVKSWGNAPGAKLSDGEQASALDILKRRYASGEIGREEFLQIRRDIEG